jgi:hypothetical protein
MGGGECVGLDALFSVHICALWTLPPPHPEFLAVYSFRPICCVSPHSLYGGGGGGLQGASAYVHCKKFFAAFVRIKIK